MAYFTGFSKLAGTGNKTLPTTAFLVGAGSDAAAGEVIWQSLAAPNFSAASLRYFRSLLRSSKLGKQLGLSNGLDWTDHHGRHRQL